MVLPQVGSWAKNSSKNADCYLGSFPKRICERSQTKKPGKASLSSLCKFCECSQFKKNLWEIGPRKVLSAKRLISHTFRFSEGKKVVGTEKVNNNIRMRNRDLALLPIVFFMKSIPVYTLLGALFGALCYGVVAPFIVKLTKPKEPLSFQTWVTRLFFCKLQQQEK